MSLPELTSPIRIYWDINPIAECPPDVVKIASDIIALKILSVDISATGGSLPTACYSVLNRFASSRIGVSITVSPAMLSSTVTAALAEVPPNELLLEISDIEELRKLVPLPPAVSGVSFPLDNCNWQQIPDVIFFCSKNGLKRLVFPMQRLYHGENPFYLPKYGREEIAAALSLFLADPGLRITAHDPFVWRSIFPHTPFPEGRCQAANTMLSIDSNGIVYPCPVMPVPLGDLKITSLKEIAKGVTKSKLRANLLQLPQQCSACAEAAACKGGCRGRGERVLGNWDGIDPGCR